MNNTYRKSILLYAAGIAAFSAAAQDKRPNIVFIMSDDHASQAISCYDGSLNNTPNIDRLADEGVTFTNCFCTNAISGPSRASILTGTFTHVNGFFNNHVVFDTAQINVAKVLQQSGYQTAMIGKWHLKTSPSGFDFWDILPGQGAYYNPDFISMEKKYRESGYVTDLITDKAIKWMDDRDTSQPFFVMIHHKAPHRNWQPRLDDIKNYRDSIIPIPENFFDNYKGRLAAQKQDMSVGETMELSYDLKIIHPDSSETLDARYMGLSRMDAKDRAEWIKLYTSRYNEFITKNATGDELALLKYQWYMQDYLATIDAVDENVGRVLDYLDENNLDENTIVVYTSDQGFFLGEHGWFDKRFMYEESLKMPLLMRYPKAIKAGTKRDQMLMNIDYAPTFLDYANAEIPERMQGKSFKNIIADNNNKGRDNVYYQYFEYPGEHSVQRHYGIRSHRYKLIHFYHEIDQWELYDLEKDTKEMNSVYDNPEYHKIKQDLLADLKKTRAQYGDTINSFSQPIGNIRNIADVQKVIFKHQAHRKYTGGGEGALYDGIINSPSPLYPANNIGFCGFSGVNLNSSWELKNSTKVKTVTLRFLENEGNWIFIPKNVHIEISKDNNDFLKISKCTIKRNKRPTGGYLVEYIFEVNENVKQLKFFAENIGICPEGHSGAGQPAWLFIDEIILD